MCIQSPETADIDICAFITRDTATNHIDSQHAYFCRDTYPPRTPEELEMCIMMHWWYTFMYTGYCDSAGELRISQALLLMYIHLPSVHKFLLCVLHWIIHNSLVSYVFIHENHFAVTTQNQSANTTSP